MRPVRLFSLALLIVLANIGVATDSRVWTDSTGKFQVEAEFVSVSDGMVVLKTNHQWPESLALAVYLRLYSLEQMAKSSTSIVEEMNLGSNSRNSSKRNSYVTGLK
jgi:hypothetical protein